ncbi:MAG: hypothetical protein JST11_20165 [Acidobacteria bacterium]|nr:hypothetical protein [Acidobacteriota bacterium]
MGSILLAIALGVAFGFQNWQLAKYAFALSIPWYALAWIALSSVLLGLAAGTTPRRARWWKRGPLLGLAFAIPSACGALALGLRWVPHVLAILTVGLVDALVIALLADSVSREAAVRRPPEAARPAAAVSPGFEKRGAEFRQRLLEEKEFLDRLDRERASAGDSRLGKVAEERIVWNELLDLELQDIDEQLHRIAQTGEGGARRTGNPNSASHSSSD